MSLSGRRFHATVKVLVLPISRCHSWQQLNSNTSTAIQGTSPASNDPTGSPAELNPNKQQLRCERGRAGQTFSKSACPSRVFHAGNEGLAPGLPAIEPAASNNISLKKDSNWRLQTSQAKEHVTHVHYQTRSTRCHEVAGPPPQPFVIAIKCHGQSHRRVRSTRRCPIPPGCDRA